MASFSFLLPLTLCLALLSGFCLAAQQSTRQSPFQSGQGECDIETLNPLEPGNRIQHEAGITETWDENDPQLRCAGVAVSRHVIQSKGLLVPSYNNAPSMVFVVNGDQGMLGVVFPGCPETFQSFQQSQQQARGQSQDPSSWDRHQKIHRLQRGDFFALPTGILHWVYNEGNEDLVLLVVHDVSNRGNQLDKNLRRFFLAGNQQSQQGPWQGGQKSYWTNIFHQLDTEISARVFGVNEEIIRKLKSERDARGFIVRVQGGLRVVSPRFSEEQQRQQSDNGYEETICSVRFKESLTDPERADIHTSRGGSIAGLNSFSLPMLAYVKLSAGGGRLRPDAMISPYWNLNAHSISYVISGSARVQVAGHSRRTAFDGEIHQGQLFIIPQNFVHLKHAGQQGLQWITVKTNDNAITSHLAGRTGVFRGVPASVWMHALQLSPEEVRDLKYNRKEVTVLDPQFSYEREQQGQGQGQGEGGSWSIM